MSLVILADLLLIIIEYSIKFNTNHPLLLYTHMALSYKEFQNRDFCITKQTHTQERVDYNYYGD